MSDAVSGTEAVDRISERAGAGQAHRGRRRPLF